MPERQLCSSRLTRRTCSRLPSGSASIPTRPSRLEEDGALDLVADRLLVGLPRSRAAPIASRSRSAARPPRSPGVLERHLGGVSERLNPLRADPGGRPDRAARASAVFWRILVRRSGRRRARPTRGTAGRGSWAAERSGNVSARTPRSPFGSGVRAGMPFRERLLDQHDAESGLAGAGDSDDYRMRGQVVRVEGELGRRRGACRGGTPPPRRDPTPERGRTTRRTGEGGPSASARHWSPRCNATKAGEHVASLVYLEVQGPTRRSRRLARLPRRGRAARLLRRLRRPPVRRLTPGRCGSLVGVRRGEPARTETELVPAAHLTRLFLATAATIYVVVFVAFLLLEHPGLGLGHFYYLAIALVALALGPAGARPRASSRRSST